MPAYNAEATLQQTVAEIPKLVDHVILVDDGSTDGTVELSRRLGLDTIVHDRNRGYGANQKTCYAVALDRGADIVVMVHPDYQYTPKLVPALAHCISSGLYDVALGSRILGGRALAGGMPLYKYVANAALNLIENRTLGLGMTDYHSGYLIYGRRALGLAFERLSDSFDFDLEVIASARARGLRVGEAPIPTHYGDEVSHLNPISYGLRVMRVMWKFRRGHYGQA